MERRLVLFLVLSVVILLGYPRLLMLINPPKPKDVAAEQAAGKDAAGKKAADKGKADDKKKASDKSKAEVKPTADKPGPNKVAEKPEIAAAQKDKGKGNAKLAPEPPEQIITIGSADADSSSRMLVWLTSKGAALMRAELNGPHCCDIDDRSGYLGHIVMGPLVRGKGCPVQVVGPGTPAAEAGLQAGDFITSVRGEPIDGEASLQALLEKTTKPGRKIKIEILRDGKATTLEATLRRHPLEVIKPEGDDPLSMLATIQQLDDKRLVDDEKEDRAKWDAEDKERKKGSDLEERQLKDSRYLGSIRHELAGLKLRTANWKVVPTGKKDEAQFSCPVGDTGLEVVKTYRLAQVPADPQAAESLPGYHLEFEIEIRNVGDGSHKVAYRLDGPNGLPTEGKWYASKVSRNWGAAGLRDFVISMNGGTPYMVGAATIGDGKKVPAPWPEKSDSLLSFIGVDAQYFSAVLLPDRDENASAWFDEVMPIRVGKVDPAYTNLTNTSCRLISVVRELKPGESLSHKLRLFVGPKKSTVLEPYGLSELLYYGWFGMVAKPLTQILYFFYAIVGNYGLAIILLTVLVRGCMFPLSLKQAAGAQKMQMIQPEMKKLQEKHKNDSAARAKAQQELFRKHNYNPLSGCLPLFIQMPVFIGLYRSLMVAIELRDAPLFTHSIRWCSNLAAPDMLYNWSGILKWQWFTDGIGIFALGPYFNILPIGAVVLMIVQMKMFTPPPADEQAAVQQKVMKYMMIFMGLMFFKVASGLCIYFIVSSLWGLVERRFLPKAAPAVAGGPQETRADAKAQSRRTAAAVKAKK